MKIDLTPNDIDLIKSLLRGRITKEREKSEIYKATYNTEKMQIACKKYKEAQAVLDKFDN